MLGAGGFRGDTAITFEARARGACIAASLPWLTFYCPGCLVVGCVETHRTSTGCVAVDMRSNPAAEWA